jgi:membrane glycosyltransferase
LGFKEATLAHGGQTMVGVIAGLLSYQYIPSFFWWFTPVLAGLFLAVLLSMMSSSTWLGAIARRLGLFLTPEEYAPPPVIGYLKENLERAEQQPAFDLEGVYGKLMDPAVCSVHMSLLPNRAVSKRHRYELKALVYRVIEEGPERLSPAEKRALVADPESLQRLHTLAWSRKELPNGNP